MNRFDLTYLAEVDPNVTLEAVLDAEIANHAELGFYVPTREELMDTTGEYFAHLMLEHE